MKRTPLKRKTPLRATTRLARSKAVKRSNPTRKAANHARSYGAKAEWIREQKCCACGFGPPIVPIHAAHTKSGGVGRKSDSTTLVPLCGTVMLDGKPREGCHERSHRLGVRSFLHRLLGAPMEWELLASLYEQAYHAHLATAAPVGARTPAGA